VIPSENIDVYVTSLFGRNLRNNIIHHWETISIKQDLPNLYLLNVAQNIYWKPDKQILSLTHLKVIKLLLLARIPLWYYHFQCYLVKKNTTIRNEDQPHAEQLPRNIENEIKPNDKLPLLDHDCETYKLILRNATYWDVLDGSGFYFHCQVFRPSNLQIIESNAASYNIPQSNPIQEGWYYTTSVNVCWKTIKKVHMFTLFIGLLTMVFNLIVVITTLRSKVLRESVAHVLVANVLVIK
jgi:hypothetical protein